MIKVIKKMFPEKFISSYQSTRNQLKQELNVNYLKIKRQFVRPSFPELPDGKINLHLGCGKVNHPDFINIDGMPGSHIHYIRRIDNLSPFKDNSVDLIYACHCLEHFSHLAITDVLGEWFRVLKDGGILRLSVPDFDLLLDIYQNNNKDLNSILRPLMGAQNYQYNFHKTTFNQQNLENLLIKTGFSKVQPWQPGSNELTTFDDWSNKTLTIKQKSYRISLNIEAIK